MGKGMGRSRRRAQTWAETQAQASVCFQGSVPVICVWLHLALLLPSCVSLNCIQTGDRVETRIRVESTLTIQKRMVEIWWGSQTHMGTTF